ncbi:hypothetical protein L2E82_18214 [Cichorium intybus]|uniref:Uncharacterized protein n=1 Tax=Cichorium intybus TaxID=13427 RepID=A0ACB9F953_CICIN|nr:hypothetical protein L2E82_18214 [Cichorium intybus]
MSLLCSDIIGINGNCLVSIELPIKILCSYIGVLNIPTTISVPRVVGLPRNLVCLPTKACRIVAQVQTRKLHRALTHLEN